MGISVEEYLHNRQACAQCQEHGDEEHCVTTLLSREDNCIFYNSVLAYHLPTRTKTTPFTPDENNAAAQADFVLLQAFREYIKTIQPDIDLNYELENGEFIDVPINLSFFWPDA